MIDLKRAKKRITESNCLQFFKTMIVSEFWINYENNLQINFEFRAIPRQANVM